MATLPVQTFDFYDNSGGIDLKSSATKIPDNKSSLALNIDYSTDGAFFTRNGTSILNTSGGIPAQMSGAPRTIGLYDYRRSDGTGAQIICAGTAIKTNLTTPTNAVTGLNAGLPIPDMEFVVTNNDELLIWGNGSDASLQYNGTTWNNLALPRPSAPTAVDNGAGSLSAGTYNYYVSYAVYTGGVIIKQSELSLAGSVTLAGGRKTTVTIPTCSETLATGVTAQCNARIIYRNNQTNGTTYQLYIMPDNATTTYNDNISDATLIATGIEASFDLQATPVSNVFELDDFNQLWSVDANNKTDVYVSDVNTPWTSNSSNLWIADGPVQCIFRCFGALIIGTDRSIWVQNGSFANAEPRRITSAFGIMNNRCCVGKSIVYILATNYKFYTITPTDFSLDQMRVSDPLSYEIDPLMDTVSRSQNENICMSYYAKSNVAKVYCSLPINTLTNSKIVIFNEAQAARNNAQCWQYYDNIFASDIGQFIINGDTTLVGGDYNGFLWNLDDSSLNGDGAEENGTASATTATTLTDSTATWTVNEFVGKVVRDISDNGTDSWGTVQSNTSTELTIDGWSGDTPASTCTYTIGGYDVYHYSNWKFLTGSWNTLKQFWFFLVNANTSGDYTIKVIFQFDFNQSISDQDEILLTLSSANAIWGSFIWGEAIWGSRSVFQDRLRQDGLFRSMRIGFYSREAGHLYQINGFGLGAQDRGMIFED